MVLVDTSVWVAHLRAGSRILEGLLLDGEVLGHPFVIGELACGNLANRKEILSLLAALPSAQVIEFEEFLSFIDRHRLMGRGIGFVDIHLLASSILAGSPLYTADKRLRTEARRMGLAYPQAAR